MNYIIYPKSMKYSPKIYQYLLIITISSAFCSMSFAQVPRAVKKGEPGYKKESLKETLDKLPVGITTPKASATLPSGNSISNIDDAKKFVSETLPDLGLKINKSIKKIKKELKATKKEFNGKDYQGLKVEKHLVRQGSGANLQFLEFYTLKEFTSPSNYVRHLYWYDTKSNRIVEGIGREKQNNLLLHGPYKKYWGEQVMEEGWYFLGAKDGRWELYDKNYNLLNKEYFDKGFYADSEISYYDEQHAKIKEVKPKSFGKVSGEYFLFNESGTLAENGMLDDSVKVGKWVEYYPVGNRRKKEIQYGKDCYDASNAYILYEYDEKGKITFDATKSTKN